MPNVHSDDADLARLVEPGRDTLVEALAAVVVEGVKLRRELNAKAARIVELERALEQQSAEAEELMHRIERARTYTGTLRSTVLVPAARNMLAEILDGARQ